MRSTEFFIRHSRPVTDIVSTLRRSLLMSSVRGRDIAPEVRVKHFLNHKGYCFRLHRKDLPAFVRPGHRVAVFCSRLLLEISCRLPTSKGARIMKGVLANQGSWKLGEGRCGCGCSMGRRKVGACCWLRGCEDDEVRSAVLANWVEGGQPIGELLGAASTAVD